MQPQQQYPQTIVVQQVAAPSNSIGLAGFILSLVGFVTCGCLSPVGLFFSLIGMLSAPRGFAFVGTILGVLGSWWLWAFGFVMVAGVLGVSLDANAELERRKKAAHESSITAPADPGAEVSLPPDDEIKLPEASGASVAAPAEPAPTVTASPAPTESKPAAVDPPVPAVRPAVPEPSALKAYPERHWTSADGNFNTMAAYMYSSGDTVWIRKTDGMVVKVPIEKLSDDDREYVRSVVEKSRK